MQVYTTNKVDARRRLDYWNAVAAEVLTPLQVSAARYTDFEGRLLVDRLGSLGIARASSSSVVIRRTSAEISRSGERVFLLNFSDEGGFRVRHGSREEFLRSGDFTLSDSAEPFEYAHAGCSAVVLRVPERVLKERLPVADDLIGLVVRGNKGAGQVASSMIRGMLKHVTDRFDERACEHLEQSLLHAVAAAYAECFGAKWSRTGTADERRRQILAFVEANLREGDVTVDKVAMALGLSARYVRLLFEARDESLSAYILRRRLEGSARDLRDPLWQSHTVSRVASNWGFNSLGSYDRAFKARFGLSPSEYRHGNAVADSPT
jgi:AraC family transcriptional regulator, positive regulator of tynA and feaB